MITVDTENTRALGAFLNGIKMLRERYLMTRVRLGKLALHVKTKWNRQLQDSNVRIALDSYRETIYLH